MDIVSSIAIALMVLGVIIVIHELGHFLVAKFFKIKVETFSVGFGPRLIGFTYGETDYRISVLPFGGYVKMAGENPGDTVTGDPHEFMSKPKWQRFLVAAAGPVMNIVLAVALLTGLFMYGTEMAEFMNDVAIVGHVEPGSPADQAGIRSGDRIVAVNGKERPDWLELDSRIAINASQPLPIVIQRNGKTIESTLTPIRKEDRGFSGMQPPIAVVVTMVKPASPAEKAGLQVGDEIVEVNGIELKSHGLSFEETLQKIDEKTFSLKIQRKGAIRELPISPAMEQVNDKPKKRIGIGITYPMVTVKLGMVDAFHLSIDKNVENGTLILTVLRKLFQRNSGVQLKNLEGPIGIIRVSGEAYRLGLDKLVMVMALISLNLGLLNLLPVPILDGGVMLLLAIEGWMGRELSLRVKERIVQVSFVALLMLTAFVLYNDVVKLLPLQTAP